MFRKLDLFLPHDRREPYQFRPLEQANLNHWTTHVDVLVEG
jgi:hypothetical protein